MSSPTRTCSYFYQYKDSPSRFVYVDEEAGEGYPSSRVFVGTLSKMNQLPVKSVLRYRDGGTTIIQIVGSRKRFEFPSRVRVEPATHGADVLLERSKVDLPTMNLIPMI